jgi:hypothetical protein
MIPYSMLDRGFAIGPLQGKKAFLPGGFHDFTTDRRTIERQARRYRDCNWGGTCDGVIVLDEDPRNGGNLDEVPGLHLDTLVVRTGSGGRHAYFRTRVTARGKLAEHNGIDIKRWSSGYTVMPGSVHPETGEFYRVETDAEIAPLPNPLLPLVEVPQYRPQPTVVSPERRSNGLVRKVAEANGGGRNSITFWAFCRALERGEQSLVDEIRNAAASIGLPAQEVETCLRSAQRATGRAA